jgi:hypothetical protein
LLFGCAMQGFSDVGTGHVGTESAAFKSSVFVGWSQNFYERIKSHIAKASAAVGKYYEGCYISIVAPAPILGLTKQ